MVGLNSEVVLSTEPPLILRYGNASILIRVVRRRKFQNIENWMQWPLSAAFVR